MTDCVPCEMQVDGDGTIVYLFDELTVSSIASQADLVLADPALASVDSLGADELAQLASERGIPTAGATDAGRLRTALSQWAGERLDGQMARQSGEGLFADGYLEERLEPFSNADGGQLFAAGALGL